MDLEKQARRYPTQGTSHFDATNMYTYFDLHVQIDIHSFNKYLLSAHYGQGSGLGTKDLIVKQTHSILTFIGLSVYKQLKTERKF